MKWFVDLEVIQHIAKLQYIKQNVIQFFFNYHLLQHTVLIHSDSIIRQFLKI